MSSWAKRSRAVCGVLALLLCQSLQAQGSGLIGGNQATSTNVYAALVSFSGVATPLTGPLPTAGTVFSCAINGAGYGIIGGVDNDDPLNQVLFANLVSPSGAVSPLTYTGSVIPFGNGGQINSVAINSSGAGIIGGVDDNNGVTTIPYVALVSPSGIATALSGAGAPIGSGSILGVAINDAGNAVIGGTDNISTTYAAVVSSSGVTTTITGSGAPTGAGFVQGAAINSSGTAIVGGQDNTATYAAFVSPSGTATPITGSLPAVGFIQSVAINDQGAAIIGGQNQTTFAPYAALVSSGGVATTFSPDSPPIGMGTVNSVAINNSGAGIIGGLIYGGTPYVVLVSPAKGIQTITVSGQVPIGVGSLLSVAINDAGVSLIGGVDHVNATPYAALISPLGVATKITGSLPVGSGQISAVALQNILTDITPTSFGPGSSFANPLFAFSSQILPNHIFHYHQLLQKDEISKEVGLLAHASDKVLAHAAASAQQRENFYSLWGSAFGEYAHTKKNGALCWI